MCLIDADGVRPYPPRTSIRLVSVAFRPAITTEQQPMSNETPRKGRAVFDSLHDHLKALFLLLLLVAGAGIAAFFVASTQPSTATLMILLFLIAALVLIAVVWRGLHQRVMQPLAALGERAQRMAHDDLNQPIEVAGAGEIVPLAQAIETMRAAAKAAHEDLEARVTQRTRELTSAFEFSHEIIAQLDLDQLLRSVTDRARLLTHSDAASICLVDSDEQHLFLAACDGDSKIPLNSSQSIELVPASQVVGAGETVVLETTRSTCGFLHAHAPGQCGATPLRVGDRILGALCVVRGHDAPFDADETRALTLLANSAAIAIANARLIEAGRQQTERAATLAERERLAAELHDNLAQTLGLLKLKIDRVQEIVAIGSKAEADDELKRMKSIVGEAYGQVRAALIGLREPTPSNDDLIDQLSACVNDFRAASGLAAELVVADPTAPGISHTAQTQVPLIVREALINVRKHAQAQHVVVRIDRSSGEALFAVEDDGQGFDRQHEAGDGHLGMSIMRTRAERSGGQLSIDSAPGHGTRVVARFPIERSPSGGSGS